MKKIIEKKHRVLDDTDLNNINNTFKEIKHDNNNNFNRIDNTFKLIEKTCESMNNHMNSLEKSMNTRIDSLEKSTNTRIDSLEKSVNNKHNTLVFLISIIGIVLTALKIFY